jgi:hypothetical protein
VENPREKNKNNLNFFLSQIKQISIKKMRTKFERKIKYRG